MGQLISCVGRAPGGHCCWINGEVCRYLTPDIRCSLRTELGSWDAVHSDPRWIDAVKPLFDRLWPGYGCGDFPQGIPEVMNTPGAGRCCWEAADG